MNPAALDPTTQPQATAVTMRAIVQDAYGAAPEEVLRLAEVARPAIGDAEVLVRVAAASVDRGTWHLMAGLPYLMRAAGFGGPRTPKAINPGRCFAGTVESVGKDVTGFTAGDEVFGTSENSFAEYVAAAPGKIAPKPASLSFEQAAAVPISGATALQAVRRGGVTAGQKVLVIGASGGVGTFATQIAKALGAEVTGVCGPTKVDLVTSLGADHVVDYTEEDFAGGEHRYDVILDIGGSSRLSRLRRALTPHGRLVIVGGMTDGRWLGGIDRQVRATLLSPFVGQKLGSLMASENSVDLAALRELIDAGKLTPAIDRTYPLGEVPVAIRYLLKGKVRGKVVITV